MKIILGKKLKNGTNSISSYACFCAYGVCYCPCPPLPMWDAAVDGTETASVGPSSDDVRG